MTPSIACAKCGRVDNLETVVPLGIHMGRAVLWNCACGSTRAVAVVDYAAQELVRKAMAMDETRARNYRHPPLPSQG